MIGLTPIPAEPPIGGPFWSWIVPALILASVLLGGASLAAGQDPVSLVNPFVGTGGHGHTYPGATLPFGMVQLSPDTRLEGWDGCSGYHDSDEVVYGFSHTHLSGTGVSDYGDVLLMPHAGEPRIENGHALGPDKGYASRFDKKTERAEPGYYAVHLADYGIDVELTATERTGLHRYVLPADRPAHVVVDLDHRDELLDSSLEFIDERTISGHRRSTGWARDQVVYFFASFSRPFEVTRTMGDPDQGLRRAVLSFGEDGGELLVRVGISAVDVDGARLNLEAELANRSFDEVRAEARDTWTDALGRIRVEGGTEKERRIFYTALYHSLLAPNLYSDVDGRYRGMDRAIHRAEGRRHYTVFSLWDTFRATHPLLTWIEPERTREFIETFLAHYREGGRLPVWELAGNETDTMIGYHSISVIAEAWLKGLREFDANAALGAMIDSATRDHFGLEAYRAHGFIGAEDESESVSKTLEYAYDDACIARMAAGLGRVALAKEYRARSQGWRHLLDPASGFMRPRRDQRWLDPFDPRRVDNNYTEANSWQYSFFVPHDVEGLIAALGGDRAFLSRLDDLFEESPETTGRDQPDITGLIGQYAHGNEPSHHMAWLYHYAGRPDRSIERVREILRSQYGIEPGGLSGNEDCGQMSSWYVWSAMGLYPVSPCAGTYTLGSPLFDRVTVRPDGGRAFVIRANDGGPRKIHVRGARLGRRSLTRSYLRHEELTAGGELVLELGTRRNRRWGAKPADRPPSRIEGPRVLAAPFVIGPEKRFAESIRVELGCAEEGATIRFAPARDAADAWQTYRGPIELRESTRLRLIAEKDGRRSPIVHADFHKLPNDWDIEVHTAPNPQYTAGGSSALIDGLPGGRDWRTGGWQGFQYADFMATVDLGKASTVRRAGARFLQDVRSWIWMPALVVVSVSTDGERFREVARAASDVAPDLQGIEIRDIVAGLSGVEARYVRIEARNYGEIPDWHPGRGDGAFIFVDEILID